MSNVCGKCGQELHNAQTVEEIGAALRNHFLPNRWENLQVGDFQPVPNLGQARIAALSDNFDDDPGYSTLHVFAVFETRGRFFRADGSVSSYDGLEWDGTIREVSPTKKEVVVYE